MSIIIISIIAVIVIPNITPVKDEAEEEKKIIDLHNIQLAIDSYYLGNKKYPTINGHPNIINKQVDFNLIRPSLSKDINIDNPENYKVTPEGKLVYQDKENIKSGNLYVWDLSDIGGILKDVKEMGLNTVNVPLKISVDNTESNTMYINPSDKKDTIKVVDRLTKEGVNIILEPYPFVNEGHSSETEWEPSDINGFFWNWKTIVLEELINDIAVPYDVYAVIISSNLEKIEYAEGYWRDVIDFVRSKYSGKVTYRTNWWYTATWDEESLQKYQRKLNNPLFGELDFISISAYFELNEEKVSTVEELKEDIYSTKKFNREQNVYEEVKSFYNKWEVPIFFGELGFPKREFASSEPWNPNSSDVYSNLAQRNLVAAYKEVFEEEEWLLGFSIFHIGYEDSLTNFYPDEMTKDVVRDWYKPKGIQSLTK